MWYKNEIHIKKIKKIKKFELPTQESLKKQIFNVEKDSLKYFKINLILSPTDEYYDMIYDFLTSNLQN